MDILDVIHSGGANVALHDQSRSLRTSAEAFLTVYDSYLGSSVVAASPQAERVLGAVMMLRPDINATGHGSTLIFDVNVASGTLLAHAARRLRDMGNTSPLVGVALHSLVGARPDWKIEGLKDLVVVGLVDIASAVGQTTKCPDGRVQLAR